MRTRVEYATGRIDLDADFDIMVDGYVHYTIDNNHGADADGNRGWCEVTVEDVTMVQAYDVDGDEIELTEEGLEKAKQAISTSFLER